MLECDVAVIGAGPGGYVAAIRAAQFGAKTVVIERAELGGVCLNCGCIPTKTLIQTAELYTKLERAAEYGLRIQSVKLDMKALIARKNDVIKRNKSGMRALLKANGIEVVKADATVAAPGAIKADDHEIKAKAIIIATGSAPAQVPGLETDGQRVITSTEALELTAIPERAAVVGAGPVGAEFACLWNAFGSNVTLIEMMPNMLPLDDAELTRQLESGLKKRGVDVRTKTTVDKMDVAREGVRLELKGAKKGVVEVNTVLVAVGFKYNTEVVTATPSLGVALDGQGAIKVDERMETAVPGVFAVGDVTGKTMLAHGASAEGMVAAENATGGSSTMDYRVVPWCTFTSPELAHVGMTEPQAREAGIDVKVGRFMFASSGRAVAMGETEGMVKVIGDGATDEVIGVHILGAGAGELIAAAAVAMTMEATVEEIAHTIHTHPTLSEAMMEAAEDYFGLGIHSLPKKR